jgi:RecA-family ATPase
LWHSYIYRQQATVLYEGAQAMIASPGQADSIMANVRKTIDDLATSQRNGDGLPDMIDASDFISRDIPKPKEVIAGLLHRGSKIGISGGSKTCKTWNLLNLAISAQAGARWLIFDTPQSKVLFCNFEIREFSWQHRIDAICKARNIALIPGQLILWNLRGHAADYQSLLPKSIAATLQHDFDLIIIDPIYKLYGSAKENDAGDMALLFNAIEVISTKSGASVAFGSHFSKGNQAAKEAIDRVSGSGVFNRDPDTLLTFTKHEEADAFTVETSVRDFPPVPPFVVRWKFPLMFPDESLDPAKLKQPKGRKSDHSPDDLLSTLQGKNLSTSDWRKTAEIDAGIKERSFYRLKRLLSESNLISQSHLTGSWFVTSKKPLP